MIGALNTTCQRDRVLEVVRGAWNRTVYVLHGRKSIPEESLTAPLVAAGVRVLPQPAPRACLTYLSGWWDTSGMSKPSFVTWLSASDYAGAWHLEEDVIFGGGEWENLFSADSEAADKYDL